MDVTPPLPGSVADGKAESHDLKYSSETASKYTNWNGFSDPESGIASYKVDVYINENMKQSFNCGLEKTFEDHTLSMEHGDDVYFRVHGINGADSEVISKSDGFKVDQTPPVMTELLDNRLDSNFQSNNTAMDLEWNFYDYESGISEYRVTVFESRYGLKQKFWPKQIPFNVITPLDPFNARIYSPLTEVKLQDGVTYTLHVTALNGGLLSTSHETKGVTIDTTPPNKPEVIHFYL